MIASSSSRAWAGEIASRLIRTGIDQAQDKRFLSFAIDRHRAPDLTLSWLVEAPFVGDGTNAFQGHAAVADGINPADESGRLSFRLITQSGGKEHQGGVRHLGADDAAAGDTDQAALAVLTRRVAIAVGAAHRHGVVIRCLPRRR